MSGALIPTMVRPFDPWASQSEYYKSQADAYEPAQAAATVGETQARAGLIGQQAVGAGIQNQLGALNLQFQRPIMEQQIAALSGTSFNGGNPEQPWLPAAPQAAGTAPAGSIAASGGAPVSPAAGGGAGATAAMPSVYTGQNGVMVPGMGIPMPRMWYIGYLQAQDKPAALNQIISASKAALQQAVQGVVGQNGQVDPNALNTAVRNLYQQGLITNVDAAQYDNNPGAAQQLISRTMAPGDLPAVRGAQAGATAGATQAAKAPYDMQSRVIETLPGNWQSVTKPLSQWIQGQPGASAPPVTPSTVSQALTGAEASGANATSPKGAAGTRQIMPGTFQQYALPGESFNNEADRVRVSDRVIDDLWRQYPNDPARVAVGYFSGPNNVAPPGSPTPWRTDASDGNMPVSQYVIRFMQKLGGGQASATDTGGAPAGGGGGPTAGAVAVGPPEPTKGQQAGITQDQKRISDDATQVTDTQTGALRAQTAQVNLLDVLHRLPNTPVGAGADVRTGMANLLQTFGPEWVNKFVAATTPLDPSKAADLQIMQKELFQNTVGAETQGLPGARYGAMLTKFFTNTTPNINMQGPAIQQMGNIMLVGQQMVRDYSQAAAQHFNGSYSSWRADPVHNSYAPMTEFDEGWTAPQAKNAPVSYEGATQLLNGQPWGTWNKGLTNEQQAEAVGIAMRARPGATLLPTQAPTPATPAPQAPSGTATANAP